MTMITGDELRAEVRAECKKWKVRADFARLLEVYPSFLTNFLSGEKGPGFKILRHFGYEEVTMYRKIEDKASESNKGGTV